MKVVIILKFFWFLLNKFIFVYKNRNEKKTCPSTLHQNLNNKDRHAQNTAYLEALFTYKVQIKKVQIPTSVTQYSNKLNEQIHCCLFTKECDVRITYDTPIRVERLKE